VVIGDLIEDAVDNLDGGAGSGRRNQVPHHSPCAEADAYCEGGRDGPFRDHGKRAHNNFRARQRSYLSGAGGLEGMPAFDALVGVILKQKRARFRKCLGEIGRNEALEIQAGAQHFERGTRPFGKNARANAGGGLFHG
jgi:hypothetical protein